MGPFLSGHNPRLVREGGLGLGESASQGEETPGPARGSRRGNGTRGWRGVGGRGPGTPCPEPFQPSQAPLGGEGAGRRWAPVSACPKRPVCANQQEGGVRSRCPHLTPPPQTGSRSRGRGQRQYCFSHHAWRRWVMGQEEEGWIRGVSQAPCPLPPWRLRWQDSEACGGPGMANPHRGQTSPGCSPVRAGSSLRRSPGPER